MKTLRTSQIKDLLEVNAQTLRIWVDTLPPFCDRHNLPRKARTYSAQDALFFLVVKSLSRGLGIQVSALTGYSNDLLSICTKKPLGELGKDFLLIYPNEQKAELVTSIHYNSNTLEHPVMIVPLRCLVDRVFSFLIGDVIGPANLELPFPLHSVSGNDKRA